LVEPGAPRYQPVLPAGVYLVDFRVVGDGLEGDVGHGFVDEALLNVTLGRYRRWQLAGKLGLLLEAILGVSEQVVG
jgi:hypothetical protein